MIISTWSNLGKQQIKEIERNINWKTWKQRQLLSESRFVLRIALPPLSRDRKIKMRKSSINLKLCIVSVMLSYDKGLNINKLPIELVVINFVTNWKSPVLAKQFLLANMAARTD